MADFQKYPHGMFNWVDLTTTDAEVAKKFYQEIFGWTCQEIPLPQGGVYYQFYLGDKNVAGMSQMDPAMQEQGMPSMWNSYIAVDDVDAATAKAAEVGANIIMPAMDVMDQGRFSLIADSGGAMVGLWEAKSHYGADLFNTTGTLAWNELATRDAKKSITFYSDLFGWESTTDETGYTMVTNKGRSNAGMIVMDETWGDTPPHWSIYLGVEDINVAVAKIKELGGSVMFDPVDIPVGIFTKVFDPTGAGFTAMQIKLADPTPELV